MTFAKLQFYFAPHLRKDLFCPCTSWDFFWPVIQNWQNRPTKECLCWKPRRTQAIGGHLWCWVFWRVTEKVSRRASEKRICISKLRRNKAARKHNDILLTI